MAVHKEEKSFFKKLFNFSFSINEYIYLTCKKLLSFYHLLFLSQILHITFYLRLAQIIKLILFNLFSQNKNFIGSYSFLVIIVIFSNVFFYIKYFSNEPNIIFSIRFIVLKF